MRDSLKRGFEFAKSNNMTIQHIIMRADTFTQLNQECPRIRPDHFRGKEIQLSTRPFAPPWELRLLEEWVDHEGELRIYVTPDDLPENFQSSQAQLQIENSELWGMFS
jgi:hypothetical protein